MGQIFQRPLTQEQRKALAKKKKPTNEDILRGQDELFMNLLNRVATLEQNKSDLTTIRRKRG